MAKKETITKRQHYVPQVYIKNFYNESNKVTAYFLKRGNIVQIVSNNICFENYLYEYDKGKHVNKIEKEFHRLEGKIGKAVTNIAQNLNTISIQNSEGFLIPVNEDIEFMCRYLVVQLLRTPMTIHNLNIITFKAYIKFIIETLSNESEKIREVNIKEQVEELLEEIDEELKEQEEQEALLLKGKGLIALFKEVKVIDKFYDDIMQTHNIIIYKSEKLHFLSSDEPVVVTNIEDMNMKKANYYFAINPHYCIGLIHTEDMMRGKFLFKKVTYREYETITKHLVAHSTNCVFTDIISDKLKAIISEVQQKKYLMVTKG